MLIYHFFYYSYYCPPNKKVNIVIIVIDTAGQKIVSNPFLLHSSTKVDKIDATNAINKQYKGLIPPLINKTINTEIALLITIANDP